MDQSLQARHPPSPQAASEAPEPIAYAADEVGHPTDRLLRLIVGWSTIAYASKLLMGSALHVAMAMGWATYPDTMAWGIEPGMGAMLMVGGNVCMIALLAAGIQILRSGRMAVLLLRVALAGHFLIAVASLAHTLYGSEVYRSYWSTPATAASYTLSFVANYWLPILLLCLTMPPFARRMDLRD